MECFFCNAAVTSIVGDAFILQPGWAEGVPVELRQCWGDVVLLYRSVCCWACRGLGIPGSAPELPGPDSACVCLHLSAELHLLFPISLVWLPSRNTKL